MNKKTLNVLSGAGGIILAGAVYSVVQKFPSYAVHASQYVRFLLAIMAVLCGLLLVSSLFGGDGSKPTWIKAPSSFALTVILTVLCVLSMKYVGFYAAGALYMLIAAWSLGLRRTPVLIASTAVLMLLVYGVFAKFLNVPVPLGIFEEFTFSDIVGSLEKAKLAWLAL